jgi:hypothetical protein
VQPVEPIVFYDPRDLDAEHFRLIGRAYQRTKGVRLPHAGHPAGAFPSERGLLAPTVLDIAYGKFDPVVLEQTARARHGLFYGLEPGPEINAGDTAIAALARITPHKKAPAMSWWPVWRIVAADYSIALMVLDEIVSEQSLGHGSNEEFSQLTPIAPEWGRHVDHG